MTNLEMSIGHVENGPTRDLQASEKKYLAFLSFGLGIAQGCGLCFYVASGGYFGSLFKDERFFVNACAFFYLPPIATTLAQLLLDRRFDVLLGIRRVIRFRIYLSLFMVASLLAACSWLAGSAPYSGEGQLVFAIGVVLGIFAAVLLASACLLFGAIDPRLVPFLVLGQTFAGVYTNAASRILGFEPGCERWRAQAFFGLAAISVGLGVLGYWSYNRLKLLESTYQRHESLLATQNSFLSSVCSVDEHPSTRSCAGFPCICWSMAACQTLAIAMNMSLTPLANQVAQGDYDFTQQLLLVKLLSDFVGRSAFLVLIPKPAVLQRQASRGLARFTLRSVSGHALLVWLLEVARLPVWVCVYLLALGSQLSGLLAHHAVLLWLIWLPLISTGALSSSWCFVIAVTAAPEAKRAEVNLLMSFSVYAGFASGIVVALLTR